MSRDSASWDFGELGFRRVGFGELGFGELGFGELGGRLTKSSSDLRIDYEELFDAETQTYYAGEQIAGGRHQSEWITRQPGPDQEILDDIVQTSDDGINPTSSEEDSEDESFEPGNFFWCYPSMVVPTCPKKRVKKDTI